MCDDREQACVPPRRARAALFLAGARHPGRPDDAWAEAAGSLGVTAADLDASLFADLRDERRLASLPDSLTPQEAALHVNLAIARALLFRSTAIRLEILGNARAVVRHARLRGLICALESTGSGDGCVLDVSGPFSLFRRTLLYGSALGAVLPLLPWCSRFSLSAECVLDGETAVLHLRSGDPLFPSAEPRRHDSRLEERFERDFARAARDWDLVREPGRRFLLEIVGFWTPEYLAKKLAGLRAAGLSDLILCIDARLNCAAADPPDSARVVRFKRRIAVADVLRALEAGPSDLRLSRDRGVAAAPPAPEPRPELRLTSCIAGDTLKEVPGGAGSGP
jgi:predicted nuclease of restriction endonuclease-like RecB superfamily